VECDECGFEWETDVAGIAAIVARGPIGIREALNGDDAALRRRPRPHQWSVVEYTAHLADALEWYAGRLERILDEESPQFDAFDWDAACEERRYNDRAVTDVLRSLDGAVDHLLRAMARFGAVGWHRAGIGSDGTLRPASVLATRAAHEVVHHAFDIHRGPTGWDR